MVLAYIVTDIVYIYHCGLYAGSGAKKVPVHETEGISLEMGTNQPMREEASIREKCPY